MNGTNSTKNAQETEPISPKAKKGGIVPAAIIAILLVILAAIVVAYISGSEKRALVDDIKDICEQHEITYENEDLSFIKDESEDDYSNEDEDKETIEGTIYVSGLNSKSDNEKLAFVYDIASTSEEIQSYGDITCTDGEHEYYITEESSEYLDEYFVLYHNGESSYEAERTKKGTFSTKGVERMHKKEKEEEERLERIAEKKRKQQEKEKQEREAREKKEREAEEAKKKDTVIVDSDGKKIWRVYISGGSFRFSGTYSGTGNFIVKLMDSNQDLQEIICNEIGDYVVDKTVYVTPGYYFIETYCSDGSWSAEWWGTEGE